MKHLYFKLNMDEQKGCSLPDFVILAGIRLLKTNFVRMNNPSTCLILFIFLFSANLPGQNNYKRGYVITNQGDTLHGVINDAGTLRNAHFCLFKSDTHASKVQYSPEDILCYAFNEGNHYKSHEIFNKGEFRKIFIETLVSGKASLYYYFKTPEMSYFLEKADDSLIGLSNQKVSIPISATGLYGIINNDKAPLQSENFYEQFNANIYIDIYKDTLSRLFSDQPEVVNSIPNLKYTHRSLIGITKDYIYRTCGEDACIQYEKNLKLSRPYVGFYSGVQFSTIAIWESGGKNYSKSINTSSSTFPSVPISIFLDIPLKRFTELASLKLELKLNNTNYSQGALQIPDSLSFILIKSQTIGFPVSLNYRILNTKISPTIAAGKEFTFVNKSKVSIGDNHQLALHRSQMGCWFFDLGMDYKINRRLSAFAAMRMQSFQNLIISTTGTYNRAGTQDIMKNQDYELFTTRSIALHAGIKF